MRLQISVELLVYLAVSAVVLVFALHALSVWHGAYSSELGRYEVYTMVSYVNSAISSGIDVTNISAYLPSGACNYTISGNRLSTPYGILYFTGDIIAAKGLFCPGGTTEHFEVVDNSTETGLIRVSG